MAVPQLSDMIGYLKQVNIRLHQSIDNQIKRDRRKLSDLMNRNIFKNPISIYQTKEMIFDNVMERLKFSLVNLVNVKEKELIKLKNSYILKNPYKLLDNKSNRYLQIISKLETLSPLLTLKRGYTITKKDNKVINSVKKIKKGDVLSISFNDGDIDTKVI